MAETHLKLFDFRIEDSWHRALDPRKIRNTYNNPLEDFYYILSGES